MPFPALLELLDGWSWGVVVYGDGSRLKCCSHCSYPKFGSLSWIKASLFLICHQSFSRVLKWLFLTFFFCSFIIVLWEELLNSLHCLEVLHSGSKLNWNLGNRILSEAWVENYPDYEWPKLYFFFFSGAKDFRILELEGVFVLLSLFSDK